MKTTRRGLLAVLPALATTASAQEAAAAEKPTREQDLENARSGMKANAEALAKVKLPQAIEPAFVFKV
jgi:hypothetical protein